MKMSFLNNFYLKFLEKLFFKDEIFLRYMWYFYSCTSYDAVSETRLQKSSVEVAAWHPTNTNTPVSAEVLSYWKTV